MTDDDFMTLETQTVVADDPAFDDAGAQILDAAVRMLAYGGLSGFTIDRLAAEARVSKTSIYRRWPDKMAIFRAVMGYWGRRAEVSDVGHLGRELQAWYVDRQAFYNGPGWRAVAASVMELAAHAPEIGEAMAAYQRATWDTLRRILQRGIDRGDLDEGLDLDLLEQFLIGPIYYRGILGGLEITDEVVDGFLHLVLRALGYAAPDGWVPSGERP
ncbi:MAG: hypothetical protein CL466_12340 [Acidimicrobiaceae bacterium]|nr:hypothetical protein [Acidimicrobiaceae bacterium]|tara:strand:- start:76 stop:720 length:645 start_codon:yes stop_codon:yes gene_type:complete